MGYKNREIESKLEIVRPVRAKLEDVAKLARRSFSHSITDTLVGDSRDIYWKPKGVKVDFVRLRYFKDGNGQLTVKYQDRGGFVDRVEIDMLVDPKQGKAFCCQMFGKPIGSIRKKYFVYFLENEHTTLSVYQVPGDKRVFIEAEATKKRRMNQMLREIDKLPIKVKKLNKNLYSLILKPKLRKKR